MGARERRKLRQGGGAEISGEARKAQEAAMVKQAATAEAKAVQAESEAENDPTPARQLHARTLRGSADAFADGLPKQKRRRD